MTCLGRHVETSDLSVWRCASHALYTTHPDLHTHFDSAVHTLLEGGLRGEKSREEATCLRQARAVWCHGNQCRLPHPPSVSERRGDSQAQKSLQRLHDEASKGVAFQVVVFIRVQRQQGKTFIQKKALNYSPSM